MLCFNSSITTETEATRGIEALVKNIQDQTEGHSIDLALVFLSAHYAHETRNIANGLRSALKPKVLLGCTAEGVIGKEEEVEHRPAISLVTATLLGNLAPFILQPHEWVKLLKDQDEFQRRIEALEDSKLFIVLADPFTVPMDSVLAAFNAFYPGIPIVGGMASGALRPGGNAMILNDQVTNGGLVGVSLAGEFQVDIIVSQGCRPIWQPFTVNDSKDNVIHSLEGQPPLAWIEELVPELSEADRGLLNNGLYIGLAIDSDRTDLGRGDFLVRGVIGVDQQRGSIAIGDQITPGERVQFHLRDASTAQEDLEMMLLPQLFRQTPAGALLFTCNGRGVKLYDRPNGDISLIQQNLGGVHLAGLFCAGELGPIGGKNFLHGHTASLAIFRPAEGK